MGSETPGCLDDGRRAMLMAAVPVRRSAFHLLLTGHAVPLADVATAIGWTDEEVRSTVQEVAAVGMAELDDGTIVGMDGLTTRPTQHRITVDGVKLWTWCAYDIVGIAAALGISANGNTRCGACGRDLEVVVRDGEPAPSDIVGWLPSDACSNVMDEFCPRALFFCSTEHLEGWLATSPQHGEALDLPVLAEHGRREWAQLVA